MDLNPDKTISILRREEALTGNSMLRRQEIPRLLRASLRLSPAAEVTSADGPDRNSGKLINHTLLFHRVATTDH